METEPGERVSGVVVVVGSAERVENSVECVFGLCHRALGMGAQQEGWDNGEQVIDKVEGKRKEFGGESGDVLEWDDEQFEGAWGLARPEDACGIHPELYAVLGDSTRDVERKGRGRVPVELVGTGEVCLDDAGAWAEPVE